jgi:HK97 gp10 family phage protein
MDIVMNGDWQLIVDKASTDMLRRLAEAVKSDAKAGCPVDTGKLRESIDSEVEGDTARIGSNVPYAGYVEEGTRKMAAQPYLRPALYRQRGVV